MLKMTQLTTNKREAIRQVTIDKSNNKSFGICFIQGEFKDCGSGVTIQGYFIKNLVPKSAADNCGLLKPGDRIISLNKIDIQTLSEAEIIDLMKTSGNCLEIEIETLEKFKNDKDTNPIKGNGNEVTKATIEASENEEKVKCSKDALLASGKASDFIAELTSEDAAGKNTVLAKNKPDSILSQDSGDLLTSKNTRDLEDNLAMQFVNEELEGGAGEEIKEDFKALAPTAEITEFDDEINKSEVDETEIDDEIPDQFGYIMLKIRQFYPEITPKCFRRLRFKSPTQPNTTWGLALAGHRQRNCLACFVAGIDENGWISMSGIDLKPGDEMLEINGHRLRDRCHLNVSVLIQSLHAEEIILVTARQDGSAMCVKPLKQFPHVFFNKIDLESFLAEHPQARAIQIRKDIDKDTLGILIIQGKHAELGAGVFISDIRAESEAFKVGLKVGDMILAINGDEVAAMNYEDVVGLLKRSDGLIELVIISVSEDMHETKILNSETKAEVSGKEEIDQIQSFNDEFSDKLESQRRASVAADKISLNENPEIPAKVNIDGIILPNEKILLEMTAEQKPLGIIVVGGKNNCVKLGCVITHIYTEGLMGKDGRLRIYDQILEINSVPLICDKLTTFGIHQLFFMRYEKISLLVFRSDPPEVEELKVYINRKHGKELGLGLTPNEYGCTITEIKSVGQVELENCLQRGDIITKLNGDLLNDCSYEQLYILFRTTTGRLSLDVKRPKPKSARVENE